MRARALVATTLLALGCGPAPPPPPPPGPQDAGVDAGTDAGTTDSCAACGGFRFTLTCDGGTCPECDPDAGASGVQILPVDIPLVCGETFKIALHAACGTPPYEWTYQGDFPKRVSGVDLDGTVEGMVFECTPTTAQIKVTDGTGAHAFATLRLP